MMTNDLDTLRQRIAEIQVMSRIDIPDRAVVEILKEGPRHTRTELAERLYKERKLSALLLSVIGPLLDEREAERDALKQQIAQRAAEVAKLQQALREAPKLSRMTTIVELVEFHKQWRKWYNEVRAQVLDDE